MVSCGSSVKVVTSTKKVPSKTTSSSPSTTTTTAPNTKTPTQIPPSTPSTSKPKLADKVVWTAVTYKGAPYKYAGTTKAGMDCSGLVYTSFKTRGVKLPRTSALMYNKGIPIRLKNVKRGDLVFFKTSRKRSRVNHVGLVTSAENGDIKFIHSTTSRGVIVTSLSERYWKKAFVGAKRVL